ncbi:MAG: hypothetical protein JO361_11795, partial [Gammaproteobacteria bacterium]|nr:hypothetical protein [Gammaproteobacteria bacterium]
MMRSTRADPERLAGAAVRAVDLRVNSTRAYLLRVGAPCHCSRPERTLAPLAYKRSKRYRRTGRGRVRHSIRTGTVGGPTDMKKLIAAAIAAGALSIGGCSNGGHGSVTGQPNTTLFNGNPQGSTPPVQAADNTALFNVANGTLPYPTDLYFAGSTDGTLNIQPPNPLMPNQAAINALDGFSTNAVIRERFGGALSAASLQKPGSVIIVPVITDNTHNLATIGVLGPPLTLGTDFSAAPATDAVVGPSILEITPLHPLMPSTCISGGMFLGANCTTSTGYLVILTAGITDAAGQPAAPDTDYATIKAALPTCASITDPQLNGV